MSAVALPKPSGGRPPIFPPVHTSFSGEPSDDGDLQFQRFIHNAVTLLKSADQTPLDGIETLHRLLTLRRKWALEELTTRRLFASFDLPPFPSMSLDYLLEPEDKEIRVLTQLVADLDDAIRKVGVKLERLNGPVTTSDS